MPLYKRILASETTKVLIWKVTEPEEVLAKEIVLTDSCENRMLQMKSEAHRRAFLSIRHLMALEGYEDRDLVYDAFGKPHLKSGEYISISHSHNFTGIILSSSDEVGIDIEKQREKILRIAHKFTPLEEYRTIANTDALVLKLTKVWCAKESLYKIYAQPGLSFLNHIIVHDFRLDHAITTAEINFAGKKSNYALNFDDFEGFSCAYALQKN